MPTLYHRTTAGAAKAILDSGFRDRRGHFGLKNEVEVELKGVWLSDVPLEGNDFGSADRDTLLAVTLDDQDLVEWEAVEEGGVRSYREWLVPAAVINARGKVRFVSADEEEEAASRRFAPGG